MPEPPPRKRFQFHLSTAIVMMFVAGGLIWANVRNQKILEDDTAKYPFDSPDGIIYCADHYGWPATAYIRIHYKETTTMPGWAISDWSRRVDPTRADYLNAALNATVAIVNLTAVWLLCEWLIRRRAARKGA